mgnify:CR=1 FL=1
MTPLFYAVAGNHKQLCFEVLGVASNAAAPPTDAPTTILHVACFRGYGELVDRLIRTLGVQCVMVVDKVRNLRSIALQP